MLCITIDGPAGSGKSTAAKLLARGLSEKTRIPFDYLDTGSMYRSIALLGIRRGVDWELPEQLVELARQARIEVEGGRTWLDGEDVTSLVRSAEVTEKTRFAANNPEIRALMVQVQREIARRFQDQGRGVVTEGRDQGTVVFPDASLKFFITASPQERAARRVGELEKRGETPDFDRILQEINRRDAEDTARKIGPLKKPEDAIEINTDNKSIDEVVDHLFRLAIRKVPGNEK